MSGADHAVCWSGGLPGYANPLTGKVGDLTVPRTLYEGTNPLSDTVRASSGRDSNNNIIVYWSSTDGRRPAESPP